MLMHGLDDIKLASEAIGNLEIAGITCDSRQVRPGYLFAALPGAAVDGSQFISQAIDKGAKALLAPPGLGLGDSHPDIPVFENDNPRRLFAQIAARFFDGQPNHVAAVTGTNGKTSVASFHQQIWSGLHKSAGSLGTLGVHAPGMTLKGTLTTPDAAALHQILKRLDDNGVTHLAMEASSHGLAQYRLDGVKIRAAAFTNLSRDHLDYHRDMEDYLSAKARLFSEVMAPGGCAVLNADIPEFETLEALCTERGHRIISYGWKGTGIHLLSQIPKANGQALAFTIDNTRYDVELPLVGAFQAMNVLCALGLVLAEGAKAADAVETLRGLNGVRGRLELAATLDNNATVYVDYAHTPDALETVLKALRPHTVGKLTVVFGCGGDRDRGKRPQMGAAAARLADKIIVTDDNPRSEDPAAIRQDILVACPAATEIGDRAHAIATGIEMLGEGDILLVAGKGHETGQIIGNKVLPFDDAVVIDDLTDHIGGEFS
jgi:UDP-N-acetylmuramoyl-L-alanyl-D-glutamate--2,6-diaminopimelate ligase